MSNFRMARGPLHIQAPPGSPLLVWPAQETWASPNHINSRASLQPPPRVVSCLGHSGTGLPTPGTGARRERRGAKRSQQPQQQEPWQERHRCQQISLQVFFPSTFPLHITVDHEPLGYFPCRYPSYDLNTELKFLAYNHENTQC